MEPIFGNVFRKPVQTQPRWIRILMSILALFFLFWVAWCLLGFSNTVWSAYRLIPAARRDIVGRICALITGLVAIEMLMIRWRSVYYFDPPMRELATTPGSPWQIFRLGLRARWNWNGVFYTALFLYPWFGPEILIALPVGYWGWRIPLSIVCAAGWACLSQLLFHLLAIAAVFFLAATGLGGAAPRFVLPASVKPVWWAMRFIILILFVATVAVLLVKSPPEFLANSAFWRAGDWIVRALEDRSGRARLCLQYFPSVVWFDAFRSVFNDQNNCFNTGMLGYSLWIVAGIATLLFSLRAGLGISVRATWNRDPYAPRPADARMVSKPRHDPDHVHGPLEQWLIARVGRMGRAVLRLISGVFEVGGLDRHILRSLLLTPVCIGGAYALMWFVPDLVAAAYQFLQGKLNDRARADIRTFVATVWVGLIFLYRMFIWGGLRVLIHEGRREVFSGAGSLQKSPYMNVSILMVRDASTTTTRGDNRYPITEIYPVGFADAVLLPTLYTLFWMLFLGALSFFESLVAGLDFTVSMWCVLIIVPGLTELCFIAALGSATSYWIDYRRSRLYALIQNIVSAFVAVFIVLGIGMLGFFIIHHAMERGRHWIAWLGCLNILLVFDVALYMTMRWVYVRRRFDAERRQIKSLS